MCRSSEGMGADWGDHPLPGPNHHIATIREFVFRYGPTHQSITPYIHVLLSSALCT